MDLRQRVHVTVKRGVSPQAGKNAVARYVATDREALTKVALGDRPGGAQALARTPLRVGGTPEERPALWAQSEASLRRPWSVIASFGRGSTGCESRLPG